MKTHEFLIEIWLHFKAPFKDDAQYLLKSFRKKYPGLKKPWRSSKATQTTISQDCKFFSFIG